MEEKLERVRMEGGREAEWGGVMRAQMEVTLQSGVLDHNTHVMLKYCIEMMPYPNTVKCNRRHSSSLTAEIIQALFTFDSGG